MSDKSLQGYARLAGLMYLVVMAAFIAPYAILSAIAVPGDFAQTARNVASSEALFRLALSIQVFGCVGIILLSGALYALLKHVGPNLALFALAWRVGEALLLAVGVVARFAALRNYVDANGDAAIAGRETVHQLLSAGVGAASYIAFVFLAVGSIGFFSLLIKSRFIPRLISEFGILASLLMLGLSFGTLIVPGQVAAIGMTGMAPMFIAEVGAGLWLLLAGANLKHWRMRQAAEVPA